VRFDHPYEDGNFDPNKYFFRGAFTPISIYTPPLVGAAILGAKFPGGKFSVNPD
jgi:hypothetical protein